MAKVINPKTGESTEIEDDFDLKTGENRALIEAQKKGYKAGYNVVNPKTGQSYVVDDLKSAVAKGYVEGSEYAGRKDAVERANNSASGVESAARGYVQGATFDLADEASGLVSAVLNKAKSLGASDFGKDYEKTRDDERERNKEAQSANPTEYGEAQFGGGVATAFIPGIGAVGKVAKGATLGAKIVGGSTGGAVTGALSGFGRSEGSVGKQATDTAVGGLVGGIVGAALPVAVEGVKTAVKAPFKYAAGMKDRLLKNAPDAAEFLGKQGNIDNVEKFAVDSNVIDNSVSKLKKEFPDIYRGISKRLKEVTGKAKEVLDKAYGKFAVLADDADKPVSFDAHTTTDDLVKLLDEALQNPKSERFNLHVDAQELLQKARDDIARTVQLGSKSRSIEDPVTKEITEVAVPFTEGEMLKKGKQISEIFGEYAFKKDPVTNKYPKELKGLRDLAGQLKETMYANERGTYPKEALDALQQANKLFSENKKAGDAFHSLTRDADGAIGVDADKIKNALNRYEGEAGLEAAINRRRAVAGEAPQVNFEGVTKQKSAIEALLDEKATRESQKIRFDNLRGDGWVNKAVGLLPGGKYLPTSPQNRVRMLNAIDSGVAKGKAGLDAFGKKIYIQDLSEKAPILASWLKQVAEDSSRPITRAVVQSIARHAKVPEDEVESHLRELGLSIKP